MLNGFPKAFIAQSLLLYKIAGEDIEDSGLGVAWAVEICRIERKRSISAYGRNSGLMTFPGGTNAVNGRACDSLTRA